KYLLKDYIFFFSSRRRHTRLQGDWSSDVCSSDLHCAGKAIRSCGPGSAASWGYPWSRMAFATACKKSSMDSFAGNGSPIFVEMRSEERRVGKECESWWV